MARGNRSLVLYYTPDVNMLPFAARLAALSAISVPLAAMIPVIERLAGATIYLVSFRYWTSCAPESVARWIAHLQDPDIAILVVGRPGNQLPLALQDEELSAQLLEMPVSVDTLTAGIHGALTAMRFRLRLSAMRDQLERRSRELREVHQVGVALTAERDMSALQDFVVRTAREMTGADAATLYLVDDDGTGRQTLVFHVTQNDSVDVPYERLTIPMSVQSMAGFVAITGQVLRLDDAYALPEGAEYTFNPAVDRRFGYRSRSMLIVPMRNHRGQVIGVMQLINRKRRFSVKLADPATVELEVEPFSEENEQLVLSFASQAAVAIENNQLLADIERMLAGFVRASVTAIEARDPATSGHSERVARLTVGLARAVNEVGWRSLRFGAQQLKEIEYAGLLHDFGKVGVRESVLVKAKKLYDWQLDAIRNRFRLAMQVAEARSLRRQLEDALAAGPEAYPRQAARRQEDQRVEEAALDHALRVILAANEPTVLDEDRSRALLEVAGRIVTLPSGESMPLLLDGELRSLLVRRGTLDDEELAEIRSHVVHSFNFLIQIPWTHDLREIPRIAAAHHEKLDGTGYPYHLSGDDIPVQARMMTIADIFDALAAQDRPYKPAIPVPRALAILRDDAARGGIDADLLELFIAREVYRVID
ncbi:MAG TPA: HD domain-containing phosphohydrolase [Chloroflexota bacterium]|nr:HD domain-containing phosphohydrolase [Chloroflexota bacterium]